MMNTQCGLEIPEGWTEVTATKKYYANVKGTGEKVWRLEVPSPDWIESVSTIRYYTTPDGGVRSVWDLGTCAVDMLLLIMNEPEENWQLGTNPLPGTKFYINHQNGSYDMARPIDDDLYDAASKSLLPPGWERRRVTAKVFYNESTHMIIPLQDDSDPQSAPLHPSADTSLPPGWTVRETHHFAGLPYYRNVSENRDELDHPAIQLLPLLPGWEERNRGRFAIRHITEEFFGCPFWFKAPMQAKRKPHVNYLYHRAQHIHWRGLTRISDAQHGDAFYEDDDDVDEDDYDVYDPESDGDDVVDVDDDDAVDSDDDAADDPESDGDDVVDVNDAVDSDDDAAAVDSDNDAAAASDADDDDVDDEAVVVANKENDGWEASVEDEEESNLAPFVMSKPPCWHIGKWAVTDCLLTSMRERSL
jgi:hypothetical protein